MEAVEDVRDVRQRRCGYARTARPVHQRQATPATNEPALALSARSTHASMSKVHPHGTIVDDLDDDCCCGWQVCCVRCCVLVCMWSWLLVLGAVISIPHIAFDDDSLTGDERMILSAGFGGGFILISLALCCCCCCSIICCSAVDVDDSHDHGTTTQQQLRRSSIVSERTVDWAVRVVERAHAQGLLREQQTRNISASVRRLSVSVTSAERGIAQSVTSLRSSTMRASTALRTSALGRTTSTSSSAC